MASSETSAGGAAAPTGPVIFAYDGSELARLAIEDAARQVAPGRDALVVCVWQTGDVGFVPTGDRHFNAAEATEVRSAAKETAAYGASLAERARFRSQAIAVQATPTWKGIVEVAEAHSASLIVLGSHRRRGLAGHLLGSVASAVVAHTQVAVLIARIV